MIAMAIIGYVLGLIDAVQSVKLQRTGQYYEDGLPAAHRKLVFGPRPTAFQLIGGALVFMGVLLAVGEFGLARLPHPWDIVFRAIEYGAWLIAETWMVLRNIALLRRL